MPTNEPTVQPRGKCPACSREVALLDDGTVARPHRNGNGDRCKGYGENTSTHSTCAACGFHSVLNRATGNVRKHLQRRVGRHGPYVSQESCPGSGQAPEPSDGAP